MIGFRKHAKEIERALQLTYGAILLTLLSLVGGAWSDGKYSGTQLQDALLTAIPGVGICLLLAVFGSIARITLDDRPEGSEKEGREKQENWMKTASSILTAICELIWVALPIFSIIFLTTKVAPHFLATLRQLPAP